MLCTGERSWTGLPRRGYPGAMAEPARETALITGASGGIGEEFAKLFASKGFDLVLVSRSAEKLDRLAASLPGRVERLAIDLSAPGSGKGVLAFLDAKGLAVDVLVNNAGFGTFGAFAESDIDVEIA